MDWSAIRAIGRVCVIVSLLYLSTQARDNTKGLRDFSCQVLVGASLGISVRLGGAIARPEASNPRVLSTPPVSQHPPVDYTTLFCAAGQVLRLSCGIMGAEAK
jgi:hypothetical protein